MKPQIVFFQEIGGAALPTRLPIATVRCFHCRSCSVESGKCKGTFPSTNVQKANISDSTPLWNHTNSCTSCICVFPLPRRPLLSPNPIPGLLALRRPHLHLRVVDGPPTAHHRQPSLVVPRQLRASGVARHLRGAVDVQDPGASSLSNASTYQLINPSTHQLPTHTPEVRYVPVLSCQE